MRHRRLLVGLSALAGTGLLVACGSPTTPAKASAPTPSPTAIAVVPTPSAAPSPGASTPATPPGAPTPTARPSRASGCPSPAGAPVTTAPGSGRTVALTFDDGSGSYTSQILAVLQRYGVHATFFDTGLHDSVDAQDVRAILAAGDVVGNHTYNHPLNWGFGSRVSPAQQSSELTQTDAVLAPLIGHNPCLMRPPGGAYDPASLALVRSLGMSLVLWSVDTEDWHQPPILDAAFQQSIIARAEAGGSQMHPIILMHAGKASHEPDCSPTACAAGQVSSFRGNTVAALPTIIQFYLAHGYSFVTLS